MNIELNHQEINILILTLRTYVRSLEAEMENINRRHIALRNRDNALKDCEISLKAIDGVLNNLEELRGAGK